ncbi:MAG: scramblase [Candidatus Pacebacteria bacterium]|nr:scramblase [Candidatus Paceibacterota bacterium]
MKTLESVDGLVISQKKEWGEILSGFETRNRYAVLDSRGNSLYSALEEGGSWLVRSFLKALRPFEIFVRTPDERLVIRIHRPFRFFFYEASVYDAEGRCLGTIKRKFSLLRRIYDVIEEGGEDGLQLFGPILHPWTFTIRQGESEYGTITKKWSGLLKEGFTDADNFGVTFPVDWSVERKALFLGAVFLIDFAHFENKNNN